MIAPVTPLGAGDEKDDIGDEWDDAHPMAERQECPLRHKDEARVAWMPQPAVRPFFDNPARLANDGQEKRVDPARPDQQRGARDEQGRARNLSAADEIAGARNQVSGTAHHRAFER